MDFWRTVLVLVERWYVSVPVLVLALLAAAGIYASTPPRYESHAVAVVTEPLNGSVEYPNGYRAGAVNPLLNSNNGLNLAGSVVIQAASTAEFATRIGMPLDGSTTFDVNNGSANPELRLNNPLVFISVVSPSPAVSSGVAERALTVAADELRERQVVLGAPGATFARLTTVVAPTAPVVQQGNRMRSVAAALGLGLIGSLFATYSAESIVQARNRRRAEPDPDDGTGTDDATDTNDPAGDASGAEVRPRAYADPASDPPDSSTGRDTADAVSAGER